MKKPKWQSNFKNLPNIPNSKLWFNNSNYTLEQSITHKILKGQELTPDDKFIMSQLRSFYGDLYNALELIDFNNFKNKDFINFKNYIFYAFNYIVMLSNKVQIFQLYRVVINEKVSGSKDSLLKTKFLSYPPLHIVKKINRYNRANTPNTTLFYGSETIDTALNELKPNVGEVISIGKWVPVKNREFISYPISHGASAFGINQHSTKAYHAVLEYNKNIEQILSDFMEIYFILLGREFSKPITHHYEYLISSMFSENILDNPQNKGTNFDIECIVYPSVGNNFQRSNIAVKRDIFRHHFKLVNVTELEVKNTHYNIEQSKSPESINSVEYTNYKQTSNIIDNNIIW